MEAKDGSAGFDFEGTYTRVAPRKLIEYRMPDGRGVRIEFTERAGAVHVSETFDAETENTPELQRQGWQAILDNFAQHVQKTLGGGMKFMILVKATKDSEAGKMPPESLMAEMVGFHEEMSKAGILVDGAGLQSSAKGWRIR